MSEGVEASKQAEDGDGYGRLMLTSAPQLHQYVRTSKATYGDHRKDWFMPLTVIIMSTVQGAWVRCRIMRGIDAVERIGLEHFEGLCCFCFLSCSFGRELLSLLHPSLHSFFFLSFFLLSVFLCSFPSLFFPFIILFLYIYMCSSGDAVQWGKVP